MFTTNYDIQKILDEAKGYLKAAIALKEDGKPERSIKCITSRVYKKIDELLESAPCLKEIQIKDATEREKFENLIKFDIEYLSKYIEAIEKDIR